MVVFFIFLWLCLSGFCTGLARVARSEIKLCLLNDSVSILIICTSKICNSSLHCWIKFIPSQRTTKAACFNNESQVPYTDVQQCSPYPCVFNI